MERYVMTCDTSASAFNAGGKAPSDVNRILEGAGCRILRNDYMLRNRILRLPLIVITPLIQSFKIRRGSQLIFQHPYDTAHDAIRMMNRILMFLLWYKKVSTAVLIHDVESIRFQEKNIRDEVDLLNEFDLVVAHSPEMKNMLVRNGLTSECRVMGLFDYLVSKTCTLPRRKDAGVCFAGNLDKSVFVSHVDSINGLGIHLYGSKPSSMPETPNVTYEGRFAPDDLSEIKGGWGLVWDGDAIDRCEGCLGEYLTVNSPHKASMYLCAGLPLIVPSWSAVASVVRMRGLGIVVASLGDIEARVAAVSDEEYGRMRQAVDAYARTLMSGAHVLASLSTNMFHMQKI